MNLKAKILLFVTVFSLAIIPDTALAGSGAVALTKADASCDDPGTTNIYIDCGNGTVTDNRTGLTWLKNVGCLTMSGGNAWAGKLTWNEATIEAHNLSHGTCGLTDNSRPGDWRMATMDEWTAMMLDGLAMACMGPALTDAVGNKCHSEAPIFTNFCDGIDNGSIYWSSTSVTGTDNTHARVIDIFDASTTTVLKTTSRCLWPVRLSQGEIE